MLYFAVGHGQRGVEIMDHNCFKKKEREESEVRSFFHCTRDDILRSAIAYYKVGSIT